MKTTMIDGVEWVTLRKSELVLMLVDAQETGVDEGYALHDALNE